MTPPAMAPAFEESCAWLMITHELLELLAPGIDVKGETWL